MTSRRKQMAVYLVAAFVAAVVVMLLLAEFHEQLVDPWMKHFDVTVQSWVHAHSSSALTPLMKALTEIGAPRTDIPLCGVVAITLWLRHQRRKAALLLCSMMGAGCLVTALKLHFKRTRPDVPWHWGHEHSYSFPSGHSVMATVLYGTLLYLVLVSVKAPWMRLVACVVAVLMAAGIGYSRIYLGAHWPSDVLAGYVCGAVWLAGALGADLVVGRGVHDWHIWQRRGAIG